MREIVDQARQHRYARQLLVPGFDLRTLSWLEASSVEIVGKGAAAEICARYLAGAGLGSVSDKNEPKYSAPQFGEHLAADPSPLAALRLLTRRASIASSPSLASGASRHPSDHQLAGWST